MPKQCQRRRTVLPPSPSFLAPAEQEYVADHRPTAVADGSTLCRELGTELHGEVAELERWLAHSEAERLRLGRELEEALQHCAELEELAAGQIARSFGQGNLAERANAEAEGLRLQLKQLVAGHEDLHKQLLATTWALQQTRAENAALLAARARVELQHPDTEMRKQLVERGQEVQRLLLEREGLRGSIFQLQRVCRGEEEQRFKAEEEAEQRCSALKALCETEAKQRLAAEEHWRSSEVGRCAALKALSEAATEQGCSSEHGRSQAEPRQEPWGLRHQATPTRDGPLPDLDDIERLQRLLEVKDQHVKGLVEFIMSLLELAQELQDSHTKQTQDWAEHNMKVAAVLKCLRSELGKAKQQLKDLGGKVEEGEATPWSQTCMDLRGHLQAQVLLQRGDPGPQSVIGDVEGHCALRQRQQDARAARHRHRHHPTIAKQLVAAISGVRIAKISQKGKREEKLLQLFQAGGSDCWQLRWAPAPFNKFVARSCLDLSRVVLIGYGYMARGWAVFKDAPPARCFSVFTGERSFDFICGHESEAEAFVLALSRLCACIQGWQVPGSIRTHAKFACASGWCKLEALCRRRNITLASCFLEAVKAAHWSTVAWQSSPQAGLGISIPTPRINRLAQPRELGWSTCGSPVVSHEPAFIPSQLPPPPQ